MKGGAPALAGYVRALRECRRPPSETELIEDATRTRERLLLGLRLDEPLLLADVEDALDREAAARLAAGGLVELGAPGSDGNVALTRRGRWDLYLPGEISLP